jgi:ATP-dependent DNA helicase RecG
MRPEFLFPIFSPTTALPGVGPRIAALVDHVAGEKVVDLLWHLPTGIIDRRYQPTLADAEIDRIATLKIRIETHEPGPTRRHPYRIQCADETGFITLVFFHLRAEYLNKTYPVGAEMAISGRVEEYRGGKQMTHPDHAVPVKNFAEWP